MGNVKDLTGQRYGKLVVLRRAPDYIEANGRHKVMWECQCDCGKITIKRSEVLKRGDAQSCGCLRHHAYKKNVYDMTNDFGIGYDIQGNVFYFDKEDYERIKDYYWRKRSDGYFYATKIGETGKCISLHRFIMNDPKGYIVDHIGGEKTITDNRKANLRLATIRENVSNAKRYKHNHSGIAGVWMDSHLGKWRASIVYKGQKINLGCFTDINDAAKARKKAEKKYYKEFAYDRSQQIYKSTGGVVQ